MAGGQDLQVGDEMRIEIPQESVDRNIAVKYSESNFLLVRRTADLCAETDKD